ncbi:putative deoxythymidylate kinase [Trypoxylus dichotomus]
MSLQGKRGALLVFEGLDRSGKSTQSRLLVESLKKAGREAELMVFPDRSTPIALHLLFTANRFEKMSKMKKLLYSGVNVVVDRYSFSGIVFSSAKKGMDTDWCKFPESGLPAPDSVFFLSLPFNDMHGRPGFGHERYETISFQTEVLEKYEQLASEFNFTKIDASDSIENIQDTILNHTLKVINMVENTDLHYLDFIEKDMEFYDKENISINKGV